MTLPTSPFRLESLEVGAAPVVQLFLHRLRFLPLCRTALPARSGRAPQLPTELVLSVFISHLLLARTPLYSLPEWLQRQVPEHFNLQPHQLSLFNDDRFGRALDHFYHADRASLLTALVRQAVTEFHIDLQQLHHDTTSITFSGAYAHQQSATAATRPPLITHGFNKDHRPDLKQLLYSVTISNDGAVPVHCKIYDGNTSDNVVHIETWNFLRALADTPDFLYVADSKLCTRENLTHIVTQHGRFLTVLPATRREVSWFQHYLQEHTLAWEEVRREPNPRRQHDPDIVYTGVESPERSAEGYRIFWYRSSQKQVEDERQRQQSLERARETLAILRPRGRGGRFRTAAEALAAGLKVLQQEQVEPFLSLETTIRTEEIFEQTRRGRPTSDTPYRRRVRQYYTLVVTERTEAIQQAARCDGLFPLITNDDSLTLTSALEKYKYQPFVEKRHQQLKDVFGVAPVWLKKPERIASLLWLYFVVELVQALVERTVRQGLREDEVESLGLYPEGRGSKAPTTSLVWRALENCRRHRLLASDGTEVQRFHDSLSNAGREALRLLGVASHAYGYD